MDWVEVREGDLVEEREMEEEMEEEACLEMGWEEDRGEGTEGDPVEDQGVGWEGGLVVDQEGERVEGEMEVAG